ncbi:MAG: Xaa-Pro peptidase family protein [Oscillospiraceae bacterium]|nr:Xaa-Pro peptidase family protein [Oscillospiraceae bacterium]
MNRLQAIQNAVRDEGLDALLLTSPVARQYAAGFRSSAGAAVVTPEACLFLTDFRYIEAARERVRGMEVRMTTHERPLRKQAAEWLYDRGAIEIGFEADTLTAEELELWQKEPGFRFRPAHKLARDLRMRKDEGEIRAIEAAQRVAERALSEVLETVLRPGLTERQVCAELVYRLHLYGADGPSFPPIVVSGPNSALPHGEPGGRVLERGDCVTVDFGAALGGYGSDMTRTVFLGRADDEQKRVYGVVLQAQEAGIAAIRAGRTGAEIDEAARAVIRGAGYGDYFGHGFGHGVGIEIHEGPRLSVSGEDPIPAGAVVTAEPGIYLPGKFGVRIEDMLAVTEDGCRNLTRAPKELREIG